MAGLERHPDSTQLRRQWSLLRLLAGSGRSFKVKELAEQLGCSKSTIQRDLATLEGLFAVVEEQAGTQVRRYRVAQDVPMLECVEPFGAMQLMAIHAALSALEPMAGTHFHEDLLSVARTIRGCLAEKHNGGLDRLACVFLPHRRGYIDYAGHADIIDDLIDAIARQRVCRVSYRPGWRDHARTHEVRPLRLVWYDGALYLLCQTGRHTDVGSLAVHRIESLEPTRRGFQAPRVDVEKLLHGAFGIYTNPAEDEEVEILFDADLAWKVEERIYHPDEHKERLADGRLRYRLRTSARWEIVGWVLRFAGAAELVQPVAWRRQLKDAAARLTGRHGD